CLLQRGAAGVVAVDVGHGQLAWSLRTDPRVQVLEGTNVRRLTSKAIGGPVDVAVADLSFISLRVVAPALAGVLAGASPGDAEAVFLVKPQFEAGRGEVGRGGIVTDPTVHLRVLTTVSDALASGGLIMVAVMASPLRGASGNVEFLGHFRPAAGEPSAVGSADLEAAIAEGQTL
ncbi:MAG TPA: SAM-dependent methyltransferase, partial [Acidimicrobiia bacterium]